MTRGLLVFAVGFACTAAAGWLALPERLYQTRTQPAQFSHEAHVGPKNSLTCDTCHPFREDGSFAGIPKMETCAGCHAEPVGKTIAEKDFVERFVKTGREPEWLAYSRQPDNAFFPHSVHVTKAKLACSKCHKDHEKSTSLQPVKFNRINGYAQCMRMDDCVKCHEQNHLEHSCMDCHK